MSESSSPGCLSTIMMLLMAILSSFGSFGSSAPAVSASTRVTFSPSVVFTPEELNTAAAIMERRLAALGLTDTPVTLQFGAEIIVDLPYVDDMNAVMDVLRARGLLELVDFSGVDTAGGVWDERIIQTTANMNPDGELHPVTGLPFETILDGDDVRSAEAARSSFNDSWEIGIRFSDEAGAVLGDFTRNHLDEPLAIVLDGRVLSTPIIQSEVTTEAVIQSLYFTELSAQYMAVQIGSGSLPFALDIISINPITP